MYSMLFEHTGDSFQANVTYYEEPSKERLLKKNMKEDPYNPGIPVVALQLPYCAHQFKTVDEFKVQTPVE